MKIKFIGDPPKFNQYYIGGFSDEEHQTNVIDSNEGCNLKTPHRKVHLVNTDKGVLALGSSAYNSIKSIVSLWLDTLKMIRNQREKARAFRLKRSSIRALNLKNQ